MTAPAVSHRHDVLVVGGGLVGLALAPALARCGLDVAVVDRAPLGAGPTRSVGGGEPAIDASLHAAPDASSSWDARIYAISPGSARFLSDVGGWPPQRMEAVEAMRVEGDAGGTLAFSAYDLGERALAWIVEERALRAGLLPRLAAEGVRVMAPAAIENLAFTADAARATLSDASVVEARLVVGADGLRSRVREFAGMVAAPRPYGQTAVVANFACERPHRGIARQWFLSDGGILAWLPLPGQRISIVWSASDALSARLMELAPADLAERVAATGGHALGALEILAPPSAFPLAFLRLPAVVAHRLALVGDAAHGVHPLAGQGVNLGFGDAEALAAVLAERGPVADAGAPLLLERYARRRAEPVLAMQAVTDGLARLFGFRARWLALLRNAGLSTVDRLAPLKRALAQPALR